MTRKSPVCCGRLRSGDPCRRAPLPGEKFCRYHTAAGRIAAQLHGRKGGRPPTGGRTLKGSGDDLAETIARIQAEYPGFDLPQAVALCIREYRDASTVALRLRALALLVTAVRGASEIEIARAKLATDDPQADREIVLAYLRPPAAPLPPP
jgi:hypothetical protein